MVEYAKGGLITGNGPTVSVIQRVEDCPCGHRLFEIDGAAPQHLITKDEAEGPVGMEKMTCQQEMDR